jgi:thiamine kinase-like enzyme
MPSYRSIYHLGISLLEKPITTVVLSLPFSADHPPTFTHGDLQRKNIIVGKDGRITIIDWEFAGWYPSYWEYARAIFACGRFDDDCNEWIDLSLDVYRNEWDWMQMLILELWS